MQKSDQKLIIIYGFHNSGKTLLYNLFKREDNFISLDLHKPHFKIYEKEILKQIGEKNTKRLEKNIVSEKIHSLDCFFEEIGLLMKQFPDYNFVVKPGFFDWLYEKTYDDWIYHLYPIRHPKMCLATCYDKNLNIENFINLWLSSYDCLRSYLPVYHLIKIEEIKNNSLIKKLLKNTKLDCINTYTKFDINDYRNNIFETFDVFKSYLDVIDLKLKDFLNYLKYDIEDINLSSYLKELKEFKRYV